MRCHSWKTVQGFVEAHGRDGSFSRLLSSQECDFFPRPTRSRHSREGWQYYRERITQEEPYSRPCQDNLCFFLRRSQALTLFLACFSPWNVPVFPPSTRSFRSNRGWQYYQECSTQEEPYSRACGRFSLSWRVPLFFFGPHFISSWILRCSRMGTLPFKVHAVVDPMPDFGIFERIGEYDAVRI